MDYKNLAIWKKLTKADKVVQILHKLFYNIEMQSIALFFKAWNVVFAKKYRYIGLVGASVSTFLLFIIIPVLIIPGNDIAYQLSIMPFVDFITLIVLAFITGVAIVFNIYIFRQKKHLQKSQIEQASVTGLAALFSSFFGTITCIACAATVIGFLGLTTVTFALKYRIVFALASVFLMIGSVYLTARKVLHVCEKCSI